MGNIAKKYQLLRKRAESIINSAKKNQYLDESTQNVENLNELIHELEVHKVEMEMQNKALRATQESLEESRNMYNDLFEHAPVGYLVLDRNGIIQQANLTIAQLLESERNAFYGKDFHEYVKFFERDHLYFHLKSVFSSFTPEQMELMLETSNNKVLWVMLQSQQIINGNDPQCRMAVCDLTNTKGLEKNWKETGSDQ